MPLATVHLLNLASTTSIPEYLAVLRSENVQPLVISKPIRWIIKPEKLSVPELLNRQWDLMIIHLNSAPFPAAFLEYGDGKWLAARWSIIAGVPSSLVTDFHARNAKLLHPDKAAVPQLTGSMDQPRMAGSTQGLELNGELLEWSKTFQLGRGAVSMLNLLKFHPTQEARESYMRYGKAFAESIGSRRGGNAKIVGKVVQNQGTDGEDAAGWDEIALAHYPSIDHFTDMLASEDYQKVNHEHRLKALEDTCILCTSELDPRLGGERARL